MLPCPFEGVGFVAGFGAPVFDWAEIQRLVGSRDAGSTGTVSRELRNHGYSGVYYAEVITDGVATYKSSCTLRDGRPADEYYIEYDEEEWYVKVAMYDGRVAVEVMSCKWW